MLNMFTDVQREEREVPKLSVEFISDGQQSRLCILF